MIWVNAVSVRPSRSLDARFGSELLFASSTIKIIGLYFDVVNRH